MVDLFLQVKFIQENNNWVRIKFTGYKRRATISLTFGDANGELYIEDLSLFNLHNPEERILLVKQSKKISDHLQTSIEFIEFKISNTIAAIDILDTK